jgi:hypothetical protein
LTLQRALLVGALAVGGVMAGFAYRTAHPHLEARATQAIARLLGIAPERVRVHEARLRMPATLHLEGIDAAALHVGSADAEPDLVPQQVAKNLFLSGERTAARKLEEAVLTWRIEQLVPKRRILELYLNLVELGPGIFGIAQAAERYFGKEPDQLSLLEAAELAALLPAPRRGMDEAWARRYQALAARLPSEKPLHLGPRSAAVKPHSHF